MAEITNRIVRRLAAWVGQGQGRDARKTSFQKAYRQASRSDDNLHPNILWFAMELSTQPSVSDADHSSRDKRRS